MTPPEDGSAGDDLHALALAKMSSVLGEARARQLMQQVLVQTGQELETPDDLLAFSGELAKAGGFEGAVGAMLRVQAVLRGAKSDA